MNKQFIKILSMISIISLMVLASISCSSNENPNDTIDDNTDNNNDSGNIVYKIDTKYAGIYTFNNEMIVVSQDGYLSYKDNGCSQYRTSDNITYETEAGGFKITISFKNDGADVTINDKVYQAKKYELIQKHYGVYQYDNNVYIEIDDYLPMHTYLDISKAANDEYSKFFRLYFKEIDVDGRYILTNTANTVVKMNNFTDRYADIEVNGNKKTQAKRVRLGVDFKGIYKDVNNNTIEIKEDGSIKSVIMIDANSVTVDNKKTELGIDSEESQDRYAALKYSEGKYVYQIRCDSLFYYNSDFQMYLVEYVGTVAKDKANYVFF